LDAARTSEVFRSAYPVGRIGEVDEIARVVAFLVSNENTFMHGNDTTVDGGWMLR